MPRMSRRRLGQLDLAMERAALEVINILAATVNWISDGLSRLSM